MNKPQIQTFFEKQKKSIRNKIAFLGIGATAILFHKDLNWIAPIIIGSIVPMIIDLKETQGLIKNKPHEGGSRFTFFLNKSLTKWTDRYINKSDSLIEKKYKTLFLQLWAEHKETSFDDIIYSNVELFKELSQSLIDEELSKYSLFEMMTDSSKSIDSNGSRIVIKDFFLEDLDKPDRLEIAKKVFKEYQDIGLIGKSFLRRSNYDTLLYLQDYKFSDKDYELIKIYAEKLENDKCPFPIHYAYSSSNAERYQEVTKKTIKEILNIEDDVNKLKILNNYFDILIKKMDKEPLRIDFQINDFIETNNFIKSKIDYLELGSELQTNEISNKPNTKRPKI